LLDHVDTIRDRLAHRVAFGVFLDQHDIGALAQSLDRLGGQRGGKGMEAVEAVVDNPLARFNGLLYGGSPLRVVFDEDSCPRSAEWRSIAWACDLFRHPDCRRFRWAVKA